MQAWPLATAYPPAETFRGPRGLRKGVVQDLERLYRLRREATLGEGLTPHLSPPATVPRNGGRAQPGNNSSKAKRVLGGSRSASK
jgi:hypothetical protein